MKDIGKDLEAIAKQIESYRNFQTYRKKMKGDVSLSDNFLGFGYIYNFSNENLSVLKEYNLKGKDVLTVGSSGDQIIFSIISGAKSVVCFDVNPFAKYFYDLKVAGIKNLDMTDFVLYFSKNVFDKTVYGKISHDLHGNSKMFWDILVHEGLNEEDYRNIIFASIPATFAENYGKIKEYYLHNNPKVEFIETDFASLNSQLKKSQKFDVILLSNIADYVERWDKSNKPFKNGFLDKIDELAKNHLRKDGLIQTYVYLNRAKSLDISDDIYYTYPEYCQFFEMNDDGSKETSLVYFPPVEKTADSDCLEKE